MGPDWMITSLLVSLSQLEEIKMLCGDRKSFQMCGPSIGGKKCFVLKDEMDEDGMHVLNLKTTKDNDGNAYLISVGKAKTCKTDELEGDTDGQTELIAVFT